MRLAIRTFGLLTVAVLAVACGETPLASVGDRSSGWINEPYVVTTTTVPVTTPIVRGAEDLLWSNDEIVTESFEDPTALVAEIFARRGGDRFIQASRAEIVVVLPGMLFPAQVPNGSEWVSSQLVINNSGLIADEPSVAFGIWSAEPYTRSRSVAQLVVLRVSTDLEAAVDVEQGESPASCELFADRVNEQCEVLLVGDRDVWVLTANAGTTLVWYDAPYRYELFGRSFISLNTLTEMASDSVELGDLAPPSS
jgi:hypothetical protein